MTNRPTCSKAQRKPGSPCLFCENGSFCAHQYYCPETRRYENTQWRRCKRLNQPPPFGGGCTKDAETQEEAEKLKEDHNGTQKVNKRRP